MLSFYLFIFKRIGSNAYVYFEYVERKLLVGNQRPTVKPPISQPVGKSALLGRLQSFLPQMEQANKEIDAAGNAPEVGFEEPP